jgi:hypothetical protein
LASSSSPFRNENGKVAHIQGKRLYWDKLKAKIETPEREAGMYVFQAAFCFELWSAKYIRLWQTKLNSVHTVLFCDTCIFEHFLVCFDA